MPFLNRRQIALQIRTKAEREYREQLRAALSTPGMPAAQRHEIQRRLEQVGKPRVYSADSPPLPGAIVLTPPEPVHQYTEVDLQGMRKADLVMLAGERGLPTSGTKIMLVERLLTH